MNNIRKALDCRTGRQHVRATSGSIGRNACLAQRVWYRPGSSEALSWYVETPEPLYFVINTCAGRNWVEFSATVGELEGLLNTQYHYFRHKESGGYRIACDEYGLPGHVQKHVDFIMPTIQLDGLRPVAQSKATMQAAINITGLTGTTQRSTLITIDCLRAIYNIPVGKYNHSGNQLGIAEWADYLYLPDLKIFFENFTSPRIPSDVVPEFISIDGGKPSNLTVAKAQEVVESALDFQTAYSIIWPQQTRLYQNGDSVNVDSVGSFNIFLDALVS
jgi:tripeptidyl-peptidase-1